MFFSRRENIGVLSILLLFLASASTVLAIDPRCPVDPYADPANDPCNPLKYIPSNALTVLALLLYLIVAFTQTFMTWGIGGKFMIALVAAEYVFCLGFALRFGVHSDLHGRGIYIAEYLLIILAPCGFIAADYVFLGRLCRVLNCDKHLLIRPQRITLFFVASDVATFLVQAGGGSLSVSTNSSTSKTGFRIFQIGLVLQLLSFLFYTIVFLLFIRRVRIHEPHIWTRDSKKPFFNDWRALAFALAISCCGILVRSVYRSIEAAEGYGGKLSTTEGYFYGFDTLPLFISVATFVPFWPGRFIPDSEEDMQRLRSQESPIKYVSTIPLASRKL